MKLKWIGMKPEFFTSGALRAAALAALAALCLEGCSPSATLVNSIDMEFVYVAPGEFQMGCGEGDSECMADEKPQHRVEIERGFYLGRFEVTQAQWRRLIGNDPGRFKGEQYPVENVSWDEAQEFIRRLNSLEETNKYRLPTEAEWEYAARAGTPARFPFEASRAMEHAQFWNSASGRTHAVGEKRPNPWGFYDMHGNVWEWVWDRYAEGYYLRSPLASPRGPADGELRVLRGGSWSNDLRYLRSAHRNAYRPGHRSGNIGFRLVRLLKEPTGAEAAADAPESGGLKTPELKAPELKMPELKAPELKAPELKAPELKLPTLSW
jgi:formylglycine-generating enzyme required for sulfatase activity